MPAKTVDNTPARLQNVPRLKQDIVFKQQLRGAMLEFHSTWGLFSPRQIDQGSTLLINNLDVEPDDLTLEIGCGYGAIGLAIAKQTPHGTVHLVDKDFVAIEFTKKNAQLNGLNNCKVYLSNALGAVPSELRFNNIVSNLPAKVGNQMLSIILHDAHQQLVEGGRLCVVTVSGLRKWIKRNFEEVFGNYKKLKQGKTYTVAMAIKEPPDMGK